MSEVTLEQVSVYKISTQQQTDVPCGECNLASQSVYFVRFVVGEQPHLIGPGLCLVCIQTLGTQLQQAVRQRLRA